VYVSEVFVEKHLDVNCFDVQWQVVDESEDTPAVAIGVFDALDQREKRGGIPHGARSFYAVATRKTVDGPHPVFASFGFGSGRFGDRPFGAVSWYPLDRIVLGFEYDGRMPRPHIAYNVTGSDQWGFNVGLGWSNFERPALGFSMSYSR